MNTKIIIAALLISTAILSAQEQAEKTTKVRIKKTVNVNGVEKTTDTSYTVTGPVTIHTFDAANSEDNTNGQPDKQKQMVIITDEVQGDNFTDLDQKILLDKQVERALKAADIDGIKFDVDKILLVNDDSKETGAKDIKSSTTKVIVIKRIKIEDATADDAKTMEKQGGSIDQKLKVDQVTFYPNPNNGKFNLNFTLADKGNTTISILNPEGKIIYNEELKDFTGTYDKEIDISANPKGVYFVKIKQGAHAQLKKLILN